MAAEETAVDRAAKWAASGVSILNGVFGDYLHKHQNGLAIDMAFFHRDQSLPLDRAALLAAYPDSDGRLCIFLHGLCCNEHSWLFGPADQQGDARDGDVSYGLLLHAELGYTPLFLRYNTGRPIAESGAHFADLLDALTAAFPVPVKEIVLIGHSMGGLVIRSACELAAQRLAEKTGRGAWLDLVTKAIYIGTPHEGADLEKFAHATASVLAAVPNQVTRLIGDVLNLRSVGIKDLRHGHAPGAEADKAGRRESAPPTPIKQPDRIAHYLVAGTLNEDPQHVVSQLFGDGLVRVPGGTAQESGLPDDHIKVFPGVHHMALAHDHDVYLQLKKWISV